MFVTFMMLSLATIGQDAVANSAAPPPEVATAEYGPYFVFFGFDSSAVDRDGAAIIEQVANDFARSGNDKLMLTGHTDRAGASAYNKRLSKRRVDAVRKALVERGVSESRISIGPDGEGQPLIDTADGVREAQNRRVEIHFE